MFPNDTLRRHISARWSQGPAYAATVAAVWCDPSLCPVSEFAAAVCDAKADALGAIPGKAADHFRQTLEFAMFDIPGTVPTPNTSPLNSDPSDDDKKVAAALSTLTDNQLAALALLKWLWASSCTASEETTRDPMLATRTALQSDTLRAAISGVLLFNGDQTSATSSPSNSSTSKKAEHGKTAASASSNEEANREKVLTSAKAAAAALGPMPTVAVVQEAIFEAVPRMRDHAATQEMLREVILPLRKFVISGVVSSMLELAERKVQDVQTQQKQNPQNSIGARRGGGDLLPQSSVPRSGPSASSKGRLNEATAEGQQHSPKTQVLMQLRSIGALKHAVTAHCPNDDVCVDALAVFISAFCSVGTGTTQSLSPPSSPEVNNSKRSEESDQSSATVVGASSLALGETVGHAAAKKLGSMGKIKGGSQRFTQYLRLALQHIIVTQSASESNANTEEIDEKKVASPAPIVELSELAAAGLAPALYTTAMTVLSSSPHCASIWSGVESILEQESTPNSKSGASKSEKEQCTDSVFSELSSDSFYQADSTKTCELYRAEADAASLKLQSTHERATPDRTIVRELTALRRGDCEKSDVVGGAESNNSDQDEWSALVAVSSWLSRAARLGHNKASAVLSLVALSAASKLQKELGKTSTSSSIKRGDIDMKKLAVKNLAVAARALADTASRFISPVSSVGTADCDDVDGQWWASTRAQENSFLIPLCEYTRTAKETKSLLHDVGTKPKSSAVANEVFGAPFSSEVIVRCGHALDACLGSDTDAAVLGACALRFVVSDAAMAAVLHSTAHFKNGTSHRNSRGGSSIVEKAQRFMLVLGVVSVVVAYAMWCAFGDAAL